MVVNLKMRFTVSDGNRRRVTAGKDCPNDVAGQPYSPVDLAIWTC